MTPETWWHGTPDHSFSARKIVPRDSMFRAVFLSRSPLVAAFYAGKFGIVHGFRISESARLLDTTEMTGTPRITPDEVKALDAFCSRHVEGGFLRLAAEYFPRGPTLWDHVLLVLGLTPELGVKAMKALGFDGFVRCERTGWALGDRPGHVLSDGSAFASLSDCIVALPGASHHVIGITDPNLLVSTESLTTIDVSERLQSGEIDQCLNEGFAAQRLAA